MNAALSKATVGTQMLRQMSDARRFNCWMADTIRQFIGNGRVLEIGAGIGNMTELLCEGRQTYLATDSEADHLTELRSRLAHCTSLEVDRYDASNPRDAERFRDSFETVICLNVLEHIVEDQAAFANLYAALRCQGTAIVLVPQGASAFGSLDEVLGHKRRYSRKELEQKMRAAGFREHRIITFNRATLPGWFLNSCILRRRKLSSWQLRLFDRSVPMWRRVDRFLPWPSNSLIAIGVKKP